MSILGGPRVWAAIIGIAAAQPALAASPSVFPGHHPDSNGQRAGTISQKIIHTYIHNSDGPSGISEPAETFVQIDSQTMTCPASAASCTIVFNADVQASGGANAGNEWAICALVDGAYVNSCPYTGELLADGNYGAGYTLQSMSVTPGKHTASVQVFSFDGATVGYYQIQYLLYKPAA